MPRQILCKFRFREGYASAMSPTDPSDHMRPGSRNLLVTGGGTIVPFKGLTENVAAVVPGRLYFLTDDGYASLGEVLYQDGGQPTAAQLAGLAADLTLDAKAPLTLHWFMSTTDGTVYPHTGELFAKDNQVDVRTGSLRIAALFPNPGNILRPGQFARIRVLCRKITSPR